MLVIGGDPGPRARPGITGYPSPGTLDGGLHVPDFTAIGLDPHTLQFQAAGRACGMGDLWQVLWWWQI
jgi:hypothetical protein